MPTTEVRSDIAGKGWMWKLEAAGGGALVVDDTILFLQSMKVETPVAAPVDGRRRMEIQAVQAVQAVVEDDVVGEGDDVVAALEN